MGVIWQRDNWLVNPMLPETLKEKACTLERLEKELMAFQGYGAMEIMLGSALCDEVRASFEIEGILLDSRKVRSSIARNMGLLNPEWDSKRQELGKEERAVKAIKKFMETPEILTHDAILDSHRLLEKDFGDYRNHSEAGYDGEDRIIYECPPKNYFSYSWIVFAEAI